MRGFDWRSENFRRAAVLAAVLICLALVVHGIFGANGLLTMRQKRREYDSIKLQIQQLKQQNEALQQQVSGLRSNPATIGRYAREELHMARPGELIYVLPPKTHSQNSNGAAAASQQPQLKR